MTIRFFCTLYIFFASQIVNSEKVTFTELNLLNQNGLFQPYDNSLSCVYVGPKNRIQMGNCDEIEKSVAHQKLSQNNQLSRSVDSDTTGSQSTAHWKWTGETMELRQQPGNCMQVKGQKLFELGSCTDSSAKLSYTDTGLLMPALSKKYSSNCILPNKSGLKLGKCQTNINVKEIMDKEGLIRYPLAPDNCLVRTKKGKLRVAKCNGSVSEGNKIWIYDTDQGLLKLAHPQNNYQASQECLSISSNKKANLYLTNCEDNSPDSKLKLTRLGFLTSQNPKHSTKLLGIGGRKIFMKKPQSIFGDMNRCSCQNGFAVSDEECPVEGRNLCRSCFAGYEVEYSFGSSGVKTCVEKKCHCEFGSPPAKENCPKNGMHFCGSCDDLYFLRKVNLTQKFGDIVESNICDTSDDTCTPSRENSWWDGKKYIENDCGGVMNWPLDADDLLLGSATSRNNKMWVCEKDFYPVSQFLDVSGEERKFRLDGYKFRGIPCGFT